MENVIAVAVKGLIRFNGRVLLVKRSSDTEYDADKWEFPGGSVDFGEEMEEALLREIMEETGLKVTVDRIIYTATFKTHEWRQVVIISYLCTAFGDNVAISHEHKDYIWADKARMRELLPELILKDLDKNSVWDII